ncbi:MAG: GAF domain-containing protein [Brevibacterium sp.]|nr:GAF domain-containing protein [Brevibacterium sp.]MDN5834522.1 GAF domain-containing protein [Brevibacterium sp.]MDN5877212.1 GAF domain-containing protein [Brevibacterium sp.]MDN5910013.1 GAF domain-containing protein [Brevibacterium sp.]MDN6134812.1 GAF domain-containing protein [Brevibacterium sp.]
MTDGRAETVSVGSIAEAVSLVARGTPVDRNSLEAELGQQPALIDSLLDLSTTLARWRQKDHERAALLESASELIQVRDTKRLLQKLVDRAKSLIGCDIAYLSEYDPATDELNVRASRGAISLQLPALRVPPGIGLAGSVVRDRSAHWTSDYDLTQLPHERRVDSAVRAEGMESLLGVPMVVDGEVLGALFAANRYPHEFSADEITLLSALADHASVILKTARLMGELAEAAALSAASEELAAAKANTLQRLLEVEEALTQLVLQGRGATAVMDVITETLRAEVLIVDSWLLDSPEFPQEDGFFADTRVSRQELLTALDTSHRTGRTAQISNDERLIAASVASNRRQHSGLFVHFHNSPKDGDHSIVAQAAQSLALIQMNEQSRADAENRVRGELAVDLIADARGLDELRARARSSNLTLAGPWQLLVVQAGPNDFDRIGSHLARLEPRVLITQRSPGLTVLLPRSAHRTRTQMEQLLTSSDILRESLVVVSDTGFQRAQLRTAEDELWSCVRVLNSLSITSGVRPAEDFAPYTAMFGSAPEHVERFMERMLGPLHRWDRRQSADLVTTLRTYFDHSGSIRRTATALSVHINTVKLRLERIDTVLDVDWRAPEYAFRLQVALRLDQLQRTN